MGIVFPREVILEYINKYIGETDIAEHNDWINIDSVFDSDNKKRLGFNISRNWVNDYKVGGSWSLEMFVSEHQNISKESAKMLLIKLFFELKKGNKTFTKIERVDSDYGKKELVELEGLPSYLIPPSRQFSEKSELKRKAVNFLISKNLFSEHIDKFGLTFVDQKSCWHCDGVGDQDCPVCKGKGYNPYYGRVIIPTTEKGNIVYFQGRSFMGSELRYRNVSGEKCSIFLRLNTARR